MRLFILDMSPQTPDLQPSNYVFILVRLDGAYLFVFESILSIFRNYREVVKPSDEQSKASINTHSHKHKQAADNTERVVAWPQLYAS